MFFVPPQPGRLWLTIVSKIILGDSKCWFDDVADSSPVRRNQTIRQFSSCNPDPPKQDSSRQFSTPTSSKASDVVYPTPIAPSPKPSLENASTPMPPCCHHQCQCQHHNINANASPNTNAILVAITNASTNTNTSAFSALNAPVQRCYRCLFACM